MSKTEPVDVAAALRLLEERPLTHAELATRKGELDAAALVAALSDGRPVVRANAALGLAVVGHTGRDLIPFLRDSDAAAATAAGDAMVALGPAQRAHLAAIAAALDGARPAVVDRVVRMFAELVGVADAELIGVLDTADRAAAAAVIDACERVGARGLQLLLAAARDPRVLVRLNAIRGTGRLAHLEPVSAYEVMNGAAAEDSVSDVRAAALAALAATMARSRAEAARLAGQPVPSRVPALLERALSPDELRAAVSAARIDELLAALAHPRAEIRGNGVRVLALAGAAAVPAAGALAAATRDPDPVIRGEAVTALAALGAHGVVVAPALVRALGDDDLAVVAAAELGLADLGAAATTALVDGLATPREAHGARVAAALGKLPDGPARLREALASTSVDARVNAALGLGALGRGRAGAVLAALSAATRGGNARVRAAVARAVAQIDPRPAATPAPVAIDGFEQRVLTDAELTKGKAALAAVGVGGLALRLADARAAVRANAAQALGVIGGDVASLADALAVCLRDDDGDVRLAAARSLARLGELAVAACAADVVRALRGADGPLATELAAMIQAHPHLAVDAALVAALDGADDRHARLLLELIGARPTAVALLCEAFGRPGAQAAAARGLVALGRDRLGPARAMLERARTAPEAPLRELARVTLLAIDGPATGPALPAVPRFAEALLEPAGFKGAALDAGALVAVMGDARPVVRANAVTALGTLGAAGVDHAPAIAAMLRDDDAAVRLAAARALDALGDDAVVAVAPHLVRALAGDPPLVEACRGVLAARGAKVVAALVAGLDTPDAAHGLRVAELIGALPDGRELLFAALDGPAYDAQVSAALGLGALGPRRAGNETVRRLWKGLPGPPTRRRDAVVKALTMLGVDPSPR